MHDAGLIRGRMPSGIRRRPQVNLRLPITGGKLDKALDEGLLRGWNISRMNEDWKTILAHEKHIPPPCLVRIPNQHPRNSFQILSKNDPSKSAMKTNLQRTFGIAFALLMSPALFAEEPTPEIAGLQKAAADFVTAYNSKDSAAIAALFTENGEIADLTGGELISGRDQVKARYDEVFADDPDQIAIEVDSVRLVAPNLAIEDGIYHLTPAADEHAPPTSTSYTAVLMKNGEGTWQIASTRSLKNVTDSAGQLSDLAGALKGEWTSRTSDGIQLDLAFGWDSSGKFLTGEMLTTAADSEPQEGSIRIGWDAARKSIVSWMFDAAGGSTHGVWTPTENGWLIRSEGTTAEGETLNSSQELTADGKETLIWVATNRIIDGEKQPDKTLRIVRQAPEPAAE